jgi:hypothetical protein
MTTDNISSEQCPNCLQVLHGQYCSNCGQNQKGSDRYFLTLLNEAFEGIFNLNSKAWKTFFILLFRPGYLTTEHFANRRARYISPLRLYLTTSIAFFLMLSALNFFTSDLVANAPKIDVTTPQNDNDLYGGPAKEESSIKVELETALEDKKIKSELSKMFEQKAKNAASLFENRPKIFVAKFIDSSAPVILILLPIFALALKLFYLRSKRFYTQHLVLAVHNHSFLFIFLIMIVVSLKLLSEQHHSWFYTVTSLWIFLYMVLSLKCVFKQSWFMTCFKSIALSFVYFTLSIMAIMAISLLGLISI